MPLYHYLKHAVVFSVISLLFLLNSQYVHDNRETAWPHMINQLDCMLVGAACIPRVWSPDDNFGTHLLWWCAQKIFLAHLFALGVHYFLDFYDRLVHLPSLHAGTHPVLLYLWTYAGEIRWHFIITHCIIFCVEFVWVRIANNWSKPDGPVWRVLLLNCWGGVHPLLACRGWFSSST